MKGRWAAGIEPRNFAWILKDQLAVSERPGGFAPHHRRVRRQEEILWLNAHGFTRVVSLLPSNHNLHAYDELHIPSAHFALLAHGDARPVLGDLYGSLWRWLHEGERVLLHQDELGEQVAGVVAGFLCWCGLLPEPPRAVSAVEQLVRRQMGHAGRSIVAIAAEMPPGQRPRLRVPVGAEGPGAAPAVAPIRSHPEPGALPPPGDAVARPAPAQATEEQPAQAKVAEAKAAEEEAPAAGPVAASRNRGPKKPATKSKAAATRPASEARPPAGRAAPAKHAPAKHAGKTTAAKAEPAGAPAAKPAPATRPGARKASPAKAVPAPERVTPVPAKAAPAKSVAKKTASRKGRAGGAAPAKATPGASPDGRRH